MFLFFFAHLLLNMLEILKPGSNSFHGNSYWLFKLKSDEFEQSARKFKIHDSLLLFFYFLNINLVYFLSLTPHLFFHLKRKQIIRMTVWPRFDPFLHWLPGLYCRRGYCYFLLHLKKRKSEEVLF